MAWTGTVTHSYPNPAPTDYFWVDVSFTDGTTTIVKTYKLSAAEFSTSAQITAFVQARTAEIGTMYELLNTFPVVQVTAVPNKISSMQGRMVLANMGILDQVNASMQTAGGPSLIAWEYATEWHRQSQLVMSMGVQFGFTDAQMDDLFIQASGVTV